MRTNRDAYTALAIVVGLPLGLSIIIGFPFNTLQKENALYLIQSILYFLAVFTPDLIIGSYNKTPRTKLQKVRVSARSLTSTGGLVALISFPNSETTPLEYFYEWIWLILILLTALSILAFRLYSSFGMNKVSQKMHAMGLCTIGYAILCSTVIHHFYSLSPVQTICSFLMILGVFNNQVWPGNAKLIATRKKATPSAKRAIDLVESLSFSSGITLLISLSPSNLANSIADIVAFFLIVFTTHWFFSLAKGRQSVNS